MLRLSAFVLCAMPIIAVAADDGCPKDAKFGHRVHWTTKSEVLSKEFDVFRSDSKSGEYRKLNVAPIPAAKFSARPRDYEFVDAAAEPCKVYYYYIEAISTAGKRTKISDVIEVDPAKKAAVEAPSK